VRGREGFAGVLRRSTKVVSQLISLVVLARSRVMWEGNLGASAMDKGLALRLSRFGKDRGVSYPLLESPI
jgi:hypothetical protein